MAWHRQGGGIKGHLEEEKKEGQIPATMDLHEQQTGRRKTGRGDDGTMG